MERGFLSQKESGVGRGVKEKNVNTNKTNTSSGIGVSTEYDDTMNEDNPVGVASAGTIAAGNAPGKSLYDNVTGKPSEKKFNIRTLFTPGVMVLMWLFRLSLFELSVIDLLIQHMVSSWDSMEGLDAILENGPWFIRSNPLILKKWHPDENLLKEDVRIVTVSVKLHGVPVTAFSDDGLSAIATKLGTPLMLDSYSTQSWGREGHYTCNVRVEYEWKPHRCSSCKVFGHIHEECPNNTGAGEKKTVKKPSQTSRDVPVGPKIGSKPQKEYRHIPKKPNASSIGNKKKAVEPTIELILFMNTDNDGEFACNTPIGEKIDKIERQIGEDKLRLLDNDGNPLVPTGIVESDSEVEVVFDETANLRIFTSDKDESDKGYDTNSLLEQWRDSYLDNDDYDPYDDDMYENHDLSEHLQSICDDLDITVCGMKKK
nr:hypothetical protein [Tanacetum cinerariifolium]